MQIAIGINVGNPLRLSTSVITPALTGYSDIDLALSLRKIIPSYTGYALRVVRREMPNGADDGDTLDIGFNLNNELDTEALLDFVGTGKGYVERWYIQNQPGLYMGTTDALKQPTIVDSGGNLIVVNGKPAIHQDHLGTKDRISTTASTQSATSTIYIVANITETKTILLSGNTTSPTPFVGCAENGNGQNSYNSAGGVLSSIDGVAIGANRNDMYDNSVGEQKIFTFENVNCSSWVADATDYSNTSYKGANKLQEIIKFSADTSANSGNIESELMNYYKPI